MSSLQNINRSTVKFSDRLSSLSASSTSWAKGLKLRKAALNMFVIMPLIAIPWLLGRTFFYVKYLFGLIYFGFKQGARME